MKILTHFICAVSFALLICITSCKSDDSVSPDSQLEILSLETSNAYKGDYLDEIVTIQVSSPIPYQQLRLIGRQVNGSGFAVDLQPPQSSFFGVRVNEQYQARLLLSLGCEENQTFRLTLKQISQELGEDNELTTLDFDINAGDHPSGWKRLCGAPSLENYFESADGLYIVNNYSEAPFDPFRSRISVSTDYLQWEEFGEVDSYVYDFDITNENIVHALTLNGVQSSTNGADWQTWPSNGLPLDEEFVSPLSILAEDSVVFVTYSDFSGFFTNTYRTRDQGINWEVLPTYGLTLSRLNNGNLLSLTEQAGIYLSEDSGNSWQVLTESSPTGFIQSYKVMSDSELIIVDTEEFGSANTVYRFDLNNRQYSEILRTEEIVKDIDIENNVVYVLGSDNIFKIDGSTEVIPGPDFRPSQLVLFPFVGTFGRLFASADDEFIVADGIRTYTNF